MADKKKILEALAKAKASEKLVFDPSGEVAHLGIKKVGDKYHASFYGLLLAAALGEERALSLIAKEHGHQKFREEFEVSAEEIPAFLMVDDMDSAAQEIENDAFFVFFT